MKSSVTRQKYTKRLKFFDYLGVEASTIEEKSKIFLNLYQEKGEKWAFDCIFNFMILQVQRVSEAEITGSTVQNYFKCIKLFFEMADISIPWKKISRGLPKGKKYADDRIPSHEEIQKLLRYPDRRLKAIICVMSSSGIRLGAWDYLKWGHIRPIETNGKLVAAKIVVYAGEEEEYFSYISLEAYLALEDWINYRKDSGEVISDESWLMRDLWDKLSV
jgi:integrase